MYSQCLCHFIETSLTISKSFVDLYLNRIVDVPAGDVAGVGLPVDVAEEHGLVAQREAVEGEAVKDVLPRVTIHLVEGEAQVPHVSADDVQPIIVPWGPRSSNLEDKPMSCSS